MNSNRIHGAVQVIGSLVLALFVSIKILAPIGLAVGGVIGFFILVSALAWIVRTIPSTEK